MGGWTQWLEDVWPNLWESRDNPGKRRPADVDMLGYRGHLDILFNLGQMDIGHVDMLGNRGHVDLWTCWVILGSQAAPPLDSWWTKDDCLLRDKVSYDECQTISIGLGRPFVARNWE